MTSYISAETKEKIATFVSKRIISEDASIGIGSGPIIDEIVEILIARASDIKKKRMQFYCTEENNLRRLNSVHIPVCRSNNFNQVAGLKYFIDTADVICSLTKTDRVHYQLFIKSQAACSYTWLLAKKAMSVLFVADEAEAISRKVTGIPLELKKADGGREFFNTWTKQVGGYMRLSEDYNTHGSHFHATWYPHSETAKEETRSIEEWREIQHKLNTNDCVLSHNLFCATNCTLLSFYT